MTWVVILTLDSSQVNVIGCLNYVMIFFWRCQKKTRSLWQKLVSLKECIFVRMRSTRDRLNLRQENQRKKMHEFRERSGIRKPGFFFMRRSESPAEKLTGTWYSRCRDNNNMSLTACWLLLLFWLQDVQTMFCNALSFMPCHSPLISLQVVFILSCFCIISSSSGMYSSN